MDRVVPEGASLLMQTTETDQLQVSKEFDPL